METESNNILKNLPFINLAYNNLDIEEKKKEISRKVNK